RRAMQSGPAPGTQRISLSPVWTARFSLLPSARRQRIAWREPSNSRSGDKVKVTYLRKKKEHTVTLTLKNEQGTTKVVKNADVDVLGIDVRPITDSQKKQLEINYGLEVLKVSGGKMKEAGVPKGFIIQMVNDQPMRSFDDLQEAVKDAKDQMLVIKGIFPTGKRGGFVVYLQNE
ncbi:MAG: hypothetical protein IJG46_08285, partial [Prevotella sp.]|nr:hypothetical protein [Prevotella sp.]